MFLDYRDDGVVVNIKCSLSILLQSLNQCKSLYTEGYSVNYSYIHQHTQTHIYSAKQAASKRLKSATSRKRRQNQNVEIDELASLVPLAQTSLVPWDKLSVLRLATTFLKLQSFMKESELTLERVVCRRIPSLKFR